MDIEKTGRVCFIVSEYENDLILYEMDKKLIFEKYTLPFSKIPIRIDIRFLFQVLSRVAVDAASILLVVCRMEAGGHVWSWGERGYLIRTLEVTYHVAALKF